ncbi:hypothetical protein BT69DRAFT_1321209 [Atractiella rhizophila]|nr:hypothetical protein BT69DRAFT_1321209 [Atractiella rhizophila]
MSNRDYYKQGGYVGEPQPRQQPYSSPQGGYYPPPGQVIQAYGAAHGQYNYVSPPLLQQPYVQPERGGGRGGGLGYGSTSQSPQQGDVQPQQDRGGGEGCCACLKRVCFWK